MREFKSPDLKAPRYRPEVHTIMNKEFFESFKKKHPKYKDLDNVELRKIVKYFNNTLYQTVIDTRDGVQLPEQIGWLFIGTCQSPKKQNIDFVKSKKYGVAVTNKNWETDGKLAKIFFTSYALKHKMKNREFWGFVACREFKRAVAKSYPENWNMYLVVEPTIKIKLNNTKNYLVNSTKQKNIEGLKNYNEFEL
jgi:hypothetical protein